MFQNQRKGFEANIGNGNLFDHAEESELALCGKERCALPASAL